MNKEQNPKKRKHSEIKRAKIPKLYLSIPFNRNKKPKITTVKPHDDNSDEDEEERNNKKQERKDMKQFVQDATDVDMIKHLSCGYLHHLPREELQNMCLKVSLPVSQELIEQVQTAKREALAAFHHVNTQLEAYRVICNYLVASEQHVLLDVVCFDGGLPRTGLDNDANAWHHHVPVTITGFEMGCLDKRSVRTLPFSGNILREDDPERIACHCRDDRLDIHPSLANLPLAQHVNKLVCRLLQDATEPTCRHYSQTTKFPRGSTLELLSELHAKFRGDPNLFVLMDQPTDRTRMTLLIHEAMFGPAWLYLNIYAASGPWKIVQDYLFNPRNPRVTSGYVAPFGC